MGPEDDERPPGEKRAGGREEKFPRLGVKGAGITQQGVIRLIKGGRSTPIETLPLIFGK